MQDAPLSLTSKEFLAELAAMAADLRKEIEAHQVGLDATPTARAERRRRVLVDGDFRFFAYTYFPHHIRGESSIFQAQFCDRFPKLLRAAGGVKEWWIAPRGETKSSLLTKIGPCWCAVQALLQKPAIRKAVGWQGAAPYFVDYVVLLGAETKLPTKLMEVVKTELTVNAALAVDFPEVCGKGPVWKVGEFVTKSGIKVEPFGAEQAIRGTFFGSARPKLLLGDDLITDAEAKSPTERENRWSWLERAIDYLGPPDGSVKFLGVGTVLNKDDPLSRAKQSIGHLVHHFRAIEKLPADIEDGGGLWAQCEELMRNADPVVTREHADRGEVVPDEALPSHRFYTDNRETMEAGAVTSWPSVRSLYWLMRQRAKNARAFATEMQGDPRGDEDRVFTNIRFWVSRISNWIMLGACDPSMGKGESSHPSAILVGGYDGAKLHVIEAAIKRRVPSKLKADLINVQREYGCAMWGFENNNAYEWARQDIIKAAIEQGVLLPLVGITATVDRVVRIDGMEPFVNDAFEPRIVFNAALKQILDELDTWPEPQPHHDYDGLSALEILWTLAVKRYGLIEFQQLNALRIGVTLDEYSSAGRILEDVGFGVVAGGNDMRGFL